MGLQFVFSGSLKHLYVPEPQALCFLYLVSFTMFVHASGSVSSSAVKHLVPSHVDVYS